MLDRNKLEIEGKGMLGNQQDFYYRNTHIFKCLLHYVSLCNGVLKSVCFGRGCKAHMTRLRDPLSTSCIVSIAKFGDSSHCP